MAHTADLLRNARKTGRPAPPKTEECHFWPAARETRPFAPWRNARKTGRPAPLKTEEFHFWLAARETRPFAPWRNRARRALNGGAGNAPFALRAFLLSRC